MTPSRISPTPTSGPPELRAGSAEVTTAVAASLGLWDALQLEIGETAVVTAGHPWAPAAAVVASWYGAVPVILVATQAFVPQPPVEILSPDAGSLESFRQRLSRSERVAVLELSGRPDYVDFVLETVPPFARVAFAGPPKDALAIDFYTNVHRKGLVLISTTLPTPIASHDFPGTDLLARAARLLENEERNACVRLAFPDAGLSAG